MLKPTIATICFAASCMHGAAQAPRLGDDPMDKVINAMSLDEKLDILVGSTGQVQSNATVTVGNSSDLVPGAAGQTNGIPRLGIPQTVLTDGPAGVRIDSIRKGTSRTFYCTHFPIETLLSATWNTKIVYEVGQAMGHETKHYGADMILAPATNIHRNPLNGRNFEYYSEDPHLSGKICAAMVNGVQANGIGTSVKHFALNNQETNRTANNVIGTPRTFREIYLKPFEIVVKEAQPWSIMTSYNKINGTMASQRCDLITEILRHEWGFKGMVVTDWFGGQNAVEQMNAGNDLLMPGKLSQREAIRKAVVNGHLSMEIIDRNVGHVLEYVMKTPRFKGYTADNNANLKQHAQTARTAATEGMVLLKNDKRTLPFDQKIKRLAVFGRSSYDFVGGGTGSGNVNHAYMVNLINGFENAGFTIDTSLADIYDKYISKEKANLKMPQGKLAALLPKPVIPEMELQAVDIKAAAQANDAAVITIGKTSGEFADRSISDNFCLTDNEQKLISDVSNAFHKAGKKVIVILNVCGVIETQSWKDKPDAILTSWLPGQEGGTSVADILTGKENPSGRLPMTWPLSYDDVPSKADFPTPDNIDYIQLAENTDNAKADTTSNRKNFDYTEYNDGIYVGYRYYTTKNVSVSYPFGYGLSYTTFKYGKPQVRTEADGNIEVSITVKNTGQMAGKEVVQVYIQAPGKDMDKPLRELKGFAKTNLLQSGESENVTISIPYTELASFNETDSQWQVESGTYTIMIAKNAADEKPQKATIEVKGGVTEKVKLCLLKEEK